MHVCHMSQNTTRTQNNFLWFHAPARFSTDRHSAGVRSSFRLPPLSGLQSLKWSIPSFLRRPGYRDPRRGPRRGPAPPWSCSPPCCGTCSDTARSSAGLASARWAWLPLEVRAHERDSDTLSNRCHWPQITTAIKKKIFTCNNCGVWF